MSFSKYIAIGGIGTGMVFRLLGNHTMLREESRLGELTDYKDYCKGHIITHYAAVLSNMECCLLGRVGDDVSGRALLEELQQTGISTQYIETHKKAKTMLSICYLYEDLAGGNITTANSACDTVDADYVAQCLKSCKPHADTIILAAPEVSLDAREALLKAGKKAGAFTAASFLAAEVSLAVQAGLFGVIDLVALNHAECKMLAETPEEAYEIIRKQQSDIALLLTAGSGEVRLYKDGNCQRYTVPKTEVVSTAGAGDALLGTVLAALSSGVSLKDTVPYGIRAAGIAVGDENSISLQVTKAAIDLA